MRSHLYPLAASFCLFSFLAQSSVLTVTTSDNLSGPEDGRLSLVEAIRAAKAGDTIAFGLPGDGPHFLTTPLGGYPFITVDDLTIDGYTQPGSTPNSNAFSEGKGNNARIQIFLDSRSDEWLESPDSAQPDLLVRRSTRMVNPDGSDISGYGATENGILAVFGGRHFTVRGIGFLARHTAGNKADPSIYCIALAKAATNARVQGCWFGLLPDRTTVIGGRSAVAAFRFTETVNGQSVGRSSAGLVFGTDGDGVNDRAERNVCMGQSLALALELPGARVSGNYFNLFPDGATFLDIKSYASENGLSTIESFENGRFRENTLIGTNGDGVSDEEERNVFGPSLYDHIFEFYGGNTGTNIVIAGNHFGVGPTTANGRTLYPFEVPGSADFFQISGAGEVRIGTNGDGVSDDLEANLIYGLVGDQLVDAGLAVPVVVRGNWIQGNGFLGFPFRNRDKGRDFAKYYADVITGPLLEESAVTPHLLDAFDGFFSGTVPPANLDSYPYSFVDVYLVDPVRSQQGHVYPMERLASFVEGSTQDLNPGINEFRCSLGLFTAPLGSEIVVAVTYSKYPDRSEPGSSVTGPISEPTTLLSETSAFPVGVFGDHFLQIRDTAGGVEISWPAPAGLFRLETREDAASGLWRPVVALPEDRPPGGTTVVLSKDPGRRYYRAVIR